MNSNYDKNPGIRIDDLELFSQWNNITSEITRKTLLSSSEKSLIVVESYSGVFDNEIITALKTLNPDLFISSKDFFNTPDEINTITYPDVTDDIIFGKMTALEMRDFISSTKIEGIKNDIDKISKGLVIIYGPGSSLVTEEFDILIYADMARWEIQKRMKSGRVHGLGINDSDMDFSHQYKRGYFVDWRVCDKHKQKLYPRIDYFLDTNTKGYPKMIAGKDFLRAMKYASVRPFRVIPYFDPGPWGGQWMKEVCDLDQNKENFAWCFDCVPEENSLKLFVGDQEFETPSINLVFLQSKSLLGKGVEDLFGKEFPIRFDFLDTMQGGNLSFQVHPTSGYIKKNFGMSYTQDESYYILDAGENATVYLGLKENTEPDKMIKDLREANDGGTEFKGEEHVNIWPAKKHDHFLIPAGTVHCSGKNAMVLEISATPYIFTFKMWDWGRMGLDGKPRPINIDHAEKVISWERTEEFVKNELINRIEIISEGDGWREEKTGLHELEFIETRRHWFSKPVRHNTEGSVNVLNLIEGREAKVISPNGSFEPFLVHYAETFIIPEAVKEYIIEPSGESRGKEIATIKARVRI